MIVRGLLLAVVLLEVGGRAAAQEASRPLPPPPAAPTTQPSTQPARLRGRLSAEEMLKQMLQPTTQTAAPLQPVADGGGGIVNHNTTNAVAPGAPQLNLLPEGTLITDQVGRLTRTQDGTGWEFAPITDERQMLDPPLGILPNKNLANMINASILNNNDIRFRVSGEVTEFNNRNYILIEKVAQVTAAPLKPKQ